MEIKNERMSHRGKNSDGNGSGERRRKIEGLRMVRGRRL